MKDSIFRSIAQFRLLWGADCAHFVLTATTLQLIPATSSQLTVFAETVAGIGWKEVG